MTSRTVEHALRPGVAQALPEERALAARRDEELVAERIVGRARGEPARVGHADVHCEVRHAVRVVGRAVERIHVEAEPGAGPGRARLLGEDRGAGKRRAGTRGARGLARRSRVGDEVDPALQLDGAEFPTARAGPRRRCGPLRRMPPSAPPPPPPSPPSCHSACPRGKETSAATAAPQRSVVGAPQRRLLHLASSLRCALDSILVSITSHRP